MRSAGLYPRWFDALDFLAAKDEAEELIDGAVAVLTGDHLRLGLRSAAVGMEAK